MTGSCGVYAICAVVGRASGAPHHRSLALRHNPDALVGELDPVEVAEAAGRTAGDGLEDEVELVRATRVGDRDGRAGERVVSGCGVDGGRD
jgi:hypothetical protein